MSAPDRPDQAVPAGGDDGITLRQLRYLVAVVERGSFTAAAIELHVAQPSLSQQIRLLERAVGGPLLERTPQGVHPTPAGVVFLPKARTALLAAADAARMARREIEEPGGICLAVVPGAPNAILAAAVGRWRDQHPGAAVRWHEHPDQRRVEEKLVGSPGVIAVCEPPTGWAGRMVDLGADELVLARPAASPAERSLPLARTGFEAHAPTHGTDALLDAPGLDGALALVRAGAAMAVLPVSLARTTGVHVESLPGAPVRRFVALLADEPTAAAASMAALLQDAARRAATRPAAA